MQTPFNRFVNSSYKLLKSYYLIFFNCLVVFSTESIQIVFYLYTIFLREQVPYRRGRNSGMSQLYYDSCDYTIQGNTHSHLRKENQIKRDSHVNFIAV